MVASTINLAATAEICPATQPRSNALVSSHALGRGITLDDDTGWQAVYLGPASACRPGIWQASSG
jgi:hypothetical protein